MKISTCTISYKGYGKVAGNDFRLKYLEQSLSRLKEKNVTLASYSGGFLFCRSEEEVSTLGKEISDLSKKYGIYITLGVDTRKKTTKEDDKVIKEYSLPAFAVVVSPNSTPKIWRQRSNNSKNYRFVKESRSNEERTLKLKNKTIEILICGEIFSPIIRSSLINRNIDIVIDIAHISQGFRVASAMKVLAKNGVSSYCSVHADKKNAMKHGYTPNGANMYKKVSSRLTDILIEEDPRIEIKIWET